MDKFKEKDVINGSEEYWNDEAKDLKIQEKPIVYFLGRQTGTEKSKLKQEIEEKFLNIDVDEFREYHHRKTTKSEIDIVLKEKEELLKNIVVKKEELNPLVEKILKNRENKNINNIHKK